MVIPNINIQCRQWGNSSSHRSLRAHSTPHAEHRLIWTENSAEIQPNSMGHPLNKYEAPPK